MLLLNVSSIVIAVYKGSRKSSNCCCSLGRISSFQVDFASVGNRLEFIGLTRIVGGLRVCVGRILLVVRGRVESVFLFVLQILSGVGVRYLRPLIVLVD